VFVAAYWWDVRPGKEEQFRAAWRRGTELIREVYGSLGSRLHREVRDDDTIRYVGIAEWPDRETWQKAFDAKMAYDDSATRQAFVDSICGWAAEPLLMLEVTDELLDRA
jgi:heme-degrading monooxygenase HmoA